MFSRTIKHGNRHVRLAVFVLCCLPAHLSGLHAQAENALRSVRVGVLTGRTDVRQLKILTSEGWISVNGSGNGRPFTVYHNSSDEIVVQFKRSAALQWKNPSRVIIRFYETERALISGLILEEVDFAELENEASALEVQRSNDHFRPVPLLQTPNKVKLLCYNNRDPILRSRRVRRALSYAINHGKIIKKVLGGKANLARGPFDNDSDLYNSQLESYRYNPRKAIQLLEDIGWRDTDEDGIRDKNGTPLRVTLFYQKGVRIDEQIVREIKINLLNVNVDVQPKPLKKAQMEDRLAGHDFEIVLMDHTFENRVESLAEFFGIGAPKNYMGYRNQTFESYLKFYYGDSHKNKRKTLIKSMQRLINDDQPVTFLYFKWVTHFLVNVHKFENFRDIHSKQKRGDILPFEQWIIKELRE